MKAFVIVGIIILVGFVLFIWYVRITKPDHKRKKLKIVHCSDHDAAPMFV